MVGSSEQHSQHCLHRSHTKVKLQVKSFVEEFKVAKPRSFITFRDSIDPVVKNTQADVQTGRMWSAERGVVQAGS